MLEPIQKQNRKVNITGFILLIFGTIVFIILVGLAHYHAHKAGYVIKEWELSELVLDSFKAKILFKSGVISYAITLLVALILMLDYFKERNRKIIFLILAILTSLSLVGVGAFSEDRFPEFHYIVALIFYLTLGVLTTYTSIYIIKYDKSISIFYPIIGFIAVFALIFNVTTRWFFGQAYTQRIAICFSILFFLLISGKILLRK
ncbi:MAG: hypothetical protein FK732_04625 [Asgard group archaeon]|nr:hypothetical protein [Asgard group archaeon]